MGPGLSCKDADNPVLGFKGGFTLEFVKTDKLWVVAIVAMLQKFVGPHRITGAR